MSKNYQSYRVYRAVLHLYPKAHRERYGDQMVQTLDDILAEHPHSYERIGIWLRVCKELPLNILEEHINNRGEVSMTKLIKSFGNRLVITAGVIVIISGAGIVIALHHTNQYSPTTLAQLQNSSHKAACLQKTSNNGIKISNQQSTFIGNAVATSIINVPAGTNLNLYIKSYTASRVSGTAVYSGKYGSYNFVATTIAKNTANSYSGSWKVTQFSACQ